MNVPSVVETRTERVRTSPSEEVDLSSQINQPREDQNIPAVVEPASLNIEVGTQRNDIESNEENVNNIPPSQVSRSVRSTLHVDDLSLSRDVPRESSNMYNPSERLSNKNTGHRYKWNIKYSPCGKKDIK